ncbi:hypothetical protein OF829_02650 [Sphingomonas sp. LB-2]|uniref:hypothetical protein n=1 Tax=Sphingomonas caeni TaxID=2984949 RepID=UPI00223137A2|nr:hypothetical protein [Sphingomonas caeni]MCW3846121.1 hypothetical protein [Sphingomonas caeni]
MPLFPKIERSCPYLDRLDEAMDGDFCRMCKRNVYDLTGMTDPQRAAFLAACGGDACVRYTAFVRPAVAAALVAASAAVLVAEPAMAQRHEPIPPRALNPPYVPVLLGGVPPPVEVPVVLAGEPVPPPEPPKPVQPVVAPDRGTQTKRD